MCLAHDVLKILKFSLVKKIHVFVFILYCIQLCKINREKFQSREASVVFDTLKDEQT